MPADRDYIILYRTLIEKKFMLGNGEGKLKQREIEYLSNLIEEKSRVKLSISTLKRLWKATFSNCHIQLRSTRWYPSWILKIGRILKNKMSPQPAPDVFAKGVQVQNFHSPVASIYFTGSYCFAGWLFRDPGF